MMAANTPIDRETFTHLRQGDEHALERVFHERYHPLLQEARTQIDDPAAAARVVEAVFVSIWNHREHLESADALDARLQDAVSSAATRERSRLAAIHRFEEAEHVTLEGVAHEEPTVEQSWAHVESAIHAPPPDHDRAVHLAADNTRHSAAEHVVAIGKATSWRTPAIVGAIMVVLVVGAIYLIDRASTGVLIDQAFASPDVRTAQTRNGQRATVGLNDGGSVMLAANTVLRIPPKFGGDIRVLKVRGAAEVRAESGGAPIETRVDDGAVSVSGSAYRLRDYEADSMTIVAATTAEATVKSEAASRAVPPGGAVVVSRDGTISDASAAVLQEQMAWADGQFVVHDRPLRDVLPLLKRAYSLDFGIPDSTILDSRVTVSAPLTSSRQAIEQLESSGGLKFGYQGKNMVLTKK